VAAPRYARPFVAAFLVMLVVCSLAPLNLWPFSNWELFSRLRTGRLTTWALVSVGPKGLVREVPIPRIPPAQRHSFCTVWLRHARIVDVYRFDRLLSVRVGSHSAPPRRTLAWTCDAKGAHATS
jgi:hypothetical protein